MSRARPAARPGSTAAGGGGRPDRGNEDGNGGVLGGLRRPAALGVALLTLSYLSVIYRVTDVVGGTETLAALVAATVVAATATATFVRPRAGVALGALLLGGGLAAYVLSVPPAQRELFTLGRIASDTVALLTGLSVLRLTQAQIWALAVAPGPVFVSWYLAARRRYVAAVAVGGAALLFFVLTGDADALVTLAGVLGAALAIGLDTLDTEGGLAAQWDTLALVLAVMVVCSATLSVVPGGASQSSLFDAGTPTAEANLVASSDRVSVVGSLRLSPKVRFTVETDGGGPSYWRTAAYDRYTGDGWVRSGQSRRYDGRLSDPPGRSSGLTQHVTAKTEMSVLPAAWKPVALDGGVTRTARVTDSGGVRPGTTLLADDSYTVRSAVPQYTESDLRTAGDDYPDAVRQRYLQVPSSTPDRVGERAAEIRRNAGADGAYETARAYERHLERTKGYSLDVDRPSGDIADAFLFEMESGYCTYFATTMVTMLRTQGIPARFVTGYTPGERVDEDEWVVRGLDAHAWVEAYFPEVGWVRFDPTPSGPRQGAEESRIEEARANGESGVDAAGSYGPEWTPTAEPTEPSDGTGGEPVGDADEGRPDSETESETGDASTAATETAAPSGAGGNGGDGGVPLPSPSPEQLGVIAAAAVAVAAGARRFGLAERAYRALWVRYQGGRRDPASDVERAFERLEYLLARRYRPRRTGETPRAYLAALRPRGLDERAATVGRAYERARYGGGVSREEADEAVGAVDALVREGTPLLGRIRRN